MADFSSPTLATFGLSLLLLLLLGSSEATGPRKPIHGHQHQHQHQHLHQQKLVLKYHNGRLLSGNHTLNLLWYGSFTPAQRAIVADFVTTLSHRSHRAPSVASWWSTIEGYKGGPFALSLGRQLLDEGYSHGKSLRLSDVSALAVKAGTGPNSIGVVLTAADVAVEGFCSSQCGIHRSLSRSGAYVWVGNSASQCPGECAWPFHQPIFGSQKPPLVAPNGDVGMDGVVINLAAMLAGAVTNPYRSGYFQGPPIAPLEAVTACAGMFGPGSYPGYPGRVLVDPNSGASYNARGRHGRKFLLPAMWDPKTSQCATLV